MAPIAQLSQQEVNSNQMPRDSYSSSSRGDRDHHRQRRRSRSRSRSVERNGSSTVSAFRQHASSPPPSSHRRDNRSRSPLERRSKERERDNGVGNSSNSRYRQDSRSPPPSHKKESRSRKEKKRIKAQKIDLDSFQGVDDDVMKLMGFSGFNTTKNHKVEGNITGMAQINKARKYRQYMNRKGGFNRYSFNLSPF